MYLLNYWFRIIFNQKKLQTAALSCCSEPTSCSQMTYPYMWNRQLLGFNNKTNPSERDSRNIQSGQINSLVHCEKNNNAPVSWATLKRHERPKRTSSQMVKKNPFTTSRQEKNNLQEVAVSLSKSTIKRRLHKRKYRGFTTRCKQGQTRLCQKKTTSKKARLLLETHSLNGCN